MERIRRRRSAREDSTEKNRLSRSDGEVEKIRLRTFVGEDDSL